MFMRLANRKVATGTMTTMVDGDGAQTRELISSAEMTMSTWANA